MLKSHRDHFARLFVEGSGTLRLRMRRFVRSRLDAEDVVQEAFLRGIENAKTVRVPAAFVYVAARNLAFDGRRREKTARKIALGDIALSGVESHVESVESQALTEERTRLLREAVERLPPQCRTVFALKVFQGYSYKEIAAELGICVKTVENHLARGIRETHQFLRHRYSEGQEHG